MTIYHCCSDLGCRSGHMRELHCLGVVFVGNFGVLWYNNKVKLPINFYHRYLVKHTFKYFRNWIWITFLLHWILYWIKIFIQKLFPKVENAWIIDKYAFYSIDFTQVSVCYYHVYSTFTQVSVCYYHVDSTFTQVSVCYCHFIRQSRVSSKWVFVIDECPPSECLLLMSVLQVSVCFGYRVASLACKVATLMFDKQITNSLQEVDRVLIFRRS